MDQFQSQLFNSSSTLLSAEKEWIAERIAARFGPVLPATPTILDLGSHRGDLVGRYVNLIVGRLGPGARLVCVEADPECCKELERRSARWHGVAVTVENRQIEEVLNKQTEDFDLIVAAHSFYWIDDLRGQLERCLEQCQNLVVGIRGRQGIWSVQQSLRELLGDPNERFHCGESVKALLDEMGCAYEEELAHHTVEIPSDPSRFQTFAGEVLQRSADRMSRELALAVREALGDQTRLSEASYLFYVRPSRGFTPTLTG